MKLMSSMDCGGSYYLEFETDDIEKIKKRGKELDEQMIRWYIEDNDGEISKKFMSKIHHDILATLLMMNSRRPR